MPRPEKVQAVEEIKERFSDASATFITEYRGLTVGQQQSLRNSLREAGASYKVFKLTLTRRAFADLGATELDEFLAGPTAIAFANADPVPVAKALSDFGAEHEALIIKAGWLNGAVLTPEVVAKLATIDTREVLLAKIVGAAKAPMVKMAGMLGSMTRDAASMFSQLLDKKEEEAPTADADEPPPEEPDDDSSGDEVVGEADTMAADSAVEEGESSGAPSDEAGTPTEAEEDLEDNETEDQDEPAAVEAPSEEDGSAPLEAAEDDAADGDAAEEE